MNKKTVSKATTETLEVGKLYMGYSAQSRKLSSNGRAGVVCQFEGFTDDGKVRVNTYYSRTDAEPVKHRVNMARIDERSDCYLIPLNELIEAGAVEFHLNGRFPESKPRTSPRMLQLVEDGTPRLDVFNVMSSDEASAIGGLQTAHILCGQTQDGEFTNASVIQTRQVNDLLSYLASEEEKRKRELEEKRAQIAALKEGGVRLMRGKPENGELLKTLEPFRKDLVAEGVSRRGATAFFSSVKLNEKGSSEYVRHLDTGACHAGLRECEGADYILTDVRKGSERHWELQKQLIDAGHFNVLLKFMDYLANRSPYSVAVETKDAQDIWDSGWVISTEHPSNLISSLCTATRHVWEYPARCYAFAKMVEKGVDEDIAFVACLAASGSPWKGKLNFQGSCVEHTALKFDSMQDTDIVSFCMGNMPNANKTLKEDRDYARPNRVWSLFCPSSEGDFPKGGSSLIESLRKMPEQKQEKSLNPFVTSKTSADKAIDYAVRACNKWVEDLGV
ncbi:hypothetical protein [Salinivibrio phage CW02]|uniref:Uncharacterized protein n=1 Tax=Salinivibrio phage CW02 TaxID=1161935 RepID=H9D1J4_9CAUD|nr:hypothetical protein F490_gp01 [Salinivibrio phage CW02]AFE86236.1 hypothetical protein [Salinivibrio phage CW02]